METIQSLYNRNKKWLFFTLFSTFVWGMFAHAYRFFGHDFSHDCLIELQGDFFADLHKLRLGRIFSVLYRMAFRSNTIFPWVIGCLSLIWISITVFLIIRLFKIESKLICFLTAGVFTCNISVAATAATYLGDLDCNMFALMCSVAAVYLWTATPPRKKILGFILSALLLTVTIGTYQCLILSFVTLVMLVCIIELLNGCSFRDVLLKGLRAFAIMGLAAVFYVIVLKLQELLLYTPLYTGKSNGVDSLMRITPAQIPMLVWGAYQDWFHSLVYAYSEYPGFMVKGITVFLFLICAISLILALTDRKIGILEKILCVVLVVLLPFGMNGQYITAPDLNHDLMRFSVWFFYLLALLMTDWLCKRLKGHPIGAKIGSWQRIVCLLLVALLLYGSAVFYNGLYLKKRLEYDAYLSYMTRVLEEMEEEPEYSPGETQVVFVGLTHDSRALNTVMPGFGKFTSVTGAWNSDVILSYEPIRYQAYFNYVLGTPLSIPDEQTWQEIIYSDEAAQLPYFPAEGSIVFWDDIMVVKLGGF